MTDSLLDEKQIFRPTASIENLRKRAGIFEKIRAFFKDRGVLEVETPLMCHHTVTQLHVEGIPVRYVLHGTHQEETLYLQTSPEYAMKRLLAAGSGPIYQISKAFRQGEVSPVHNPEFSMLEWYRPGFDHHQLMDEMDALLQIVLNVGPATRLPYRDIFIERLSLDPFTAGREALEKCAKDHEIPIASEIHHPDAWLDLLWTHLIEPAVGKERPLFLYDFPASQAALAKIRQTEPSLASRFEVYYQGRELANGFHELQDVREQKNRFEREIQYRATHQLPELSIDPFLLAALEHGLPDCSGVALGLDRLIMLALHCQKISEVLSFPIQIA